LLDAAGGFCLADGARQLESALQVRPRFGGLVVADQRVAQVFDGRQDGTDRIRRVGHGGLEMSRGVGRPMHLHEQVAGIHVDREVRRLGAERGFEMSQARSNSLRSDSRLA
jgi:hypothetical protein